MYMQARSQKFFKESGSFLKLGQFVKRPKIMELFVLRYILLKLYFEW